MTLLAVLETASAWAGIAVSALILVFPRFGPGSWMLACFLLPASAAAAISGFSAPSTKALVASFSGLIVAAVGAYFATRTIQRENYRTLLKGRRLPLATLTVVATALIALLQTARLPEPAGLQLPGGTVALGPAGYGSALYLLVVSVMVLAGLEQILRSAEETIRWEIKFLLLGLGAGAAALVYVSSNVLLYSPRLALLSADSLALFHVVFLISCALIAVSWKRSSGRTRVAVSQGVVYRSITLLSVGIYLITSSLLARWASGWAHIGIPTGAFIFLVSALVLAGLLLGTAFRHRVRHWIRRNVFAGRYDYRQYWLQASERVQSIDSPEIAAAALADIVHRALGAIDVTVWIRRLNPNRLQLLTVLGAVKDNSHTEVTGVIEEILAMTAPVSSEDMDGARESGNIKTFLESNRASLLVPLVSSNRIVGVLTVGSDRSGRPYGWEAREFLQVLGGHAAGEFHKSELLATLVSAREDEAFRSFSTFVLHDLKNFASTLSLIAQNAKRFQDNPAFQKDAFKSVFDTAEQIKSLCNSLRTFSGTPALNKKLEDLNEISRLVADNLDAGLKGYLRLELEDLPRAPLDSEAIGRVLQNLILNAREALTAEGTIVVRTALKGERVEVSVEDNGKGMPRNFLEKDLFVPFRTTKSAGLGIGLFQSKKIVEAHGGSISVVSREGKGTTVRVMLPVLSAAGLANQKILQAEQTLGSAG